MTTMTGVRVVGCVVHLGVGMPVCMFVVPQASAVVPGVLAEFGRASPASSPS
jgi:hypothetical protein